MKRSHVTLNESWGEKNHMMIYKIYIYIYIKKQMGGKNT